MDKPEYPANVAYVSYKYPSQASFAFEHLQNQPEFESDKVACDWHVPRKPKQFKTSASEEVPKTTTFGGDIGNKLQAFNLLKDQYCSQEAQLED